jgi:hypothetical protein
MPTRQARHLPLQSRQLLGVDHRQYAAEGEGVRQLRLKKGIQNRNRIGNTAQLDEQVLGPLGPLQ